jgi:hypothetical protein
MNLKERPVQPTALAARILGIAGALTSAGILPAASPSAIEEFETVPDHSPTELLLPAMVSGSNFHVIDPVRGDGLMYRFVVDSRFGTFAAYGRLALAKRVGEVAALTELGRKTDIGLAAGGVEEGVASEVQTAVGVVKNPVGTISGIPRGIAHLFRGYTAQAQEAAAEVQRASKSAGSGVSAPGDELRKGERAARRYADRYLGVTGAERSLYKRLGVDPYTDNRVLRDAIHKAARTEALGSLGVKFAGLPAIPGIGITQRAVDAIYNEDPAVIRQRMRKSLAGYGLAAGEAEAWLNSPVMSPTRQVLLLSTAEALDGVAGRAELFRHSIDLTSDDEAQVYLRSAGLLVLAHKSHPLRDIIPGVRLPAAERADGQLVVCAAFEAVYWTKDVAESEEQLERLLPPQRNGIVRELWIAGAMSARARGALQAREWSLHEVADADATSTRL